MSDLALSRSPGVDGGEACLGLSFAPPLAISLSKNHTSEEL
jgi:hypothetical protein